MLLNNCLRNIRTIQRACFVTISANNSVLLNKKNSEFKPATSDEVPVHDEDKPHGNIGTKYRPFKQEETDIIFDAYEEKFQYNQTDTTDLDENIKHDPFKGLSLERGQSGVFDIEELVQVLQSDNAQNIFVCSVPPNIKYVDHICIVTGKSVRHMQAIAEFVRRVYKKKWHSYDPVPRLEGEHSHDWMALDLGNIALHIFSQQARVKYDLETLWAVGPEFDEESKKQDPVVNMLEKHSVYLTGFQPAS